MLRRYKCHNCETTFNKAYTRTFVTTSLPTCPVCGSSNVTKSIDQSVALKNERK